MTIFFFQLDFPLFVNIITIYNYLKKESFINALLYSNVMYSYTYGYAEMWALSN